MNASTIEKLSPAAITCEPIRHAVEQLGVATAQHDEKCRDLVELEQTREQAEWADAEALDAARAAGKPDPRRTHVAAHDKRTEEARVEFKAAQLAIERARKELDAVIDEHGEAFAAEVRQTATDAIEKRKAGIEELLVWDAEAVEAVRVCRQLIGGDWPVYEWVELKPKQLRDVELAPIPTGTKRPTVKIAAGDVLVALMEVDRPKEPEEPGSHPLDRLRGLNFHDNRGDAAVARERAETDREDELLAANRPKQAPSTVDGVTAISPAELAAARADLDGDDD